MANALANAMASGYERARNALADVRKRPGNALLDTTRGALMGVSTDVLGYPVDLATMAMRPFGYGIEQPVGGSDWLANHLTSPTGSPAEMAGRVATGMLTPGPEEMLRMAGMLPRKGPVNELITYHGSPHRINNVDEANPMGKFDPSKIGSGEGGAAFGHGIYLAQNPRVAETYRWAGTGIDPDEVTYGGRKIQDLYDAATRNQDRAFRTNNKEAISKANAELYFWESIATRKHPDAAIAEFSDPENGWPELVGFVKSLKRNEFNVPPSGHLYTVDLPDEHIATMIDFDKPLTSQPKAVKEALKQSGLWKQFRDNASDFASPQATRGQGKGMNFYEFVAWKMGSEQKASDYLNSIGIKGVKYLDQGSRNTKRGTRNFVIFDPEIAKILKRE